MTSDTKDTHFKFYLILNNLKSHTRLVVIQLDGSGLDHVANVDNNDDHMGFVSSNWSLRFHAQGGCWHL